MYQTAENSGVKLVQIRNCNPLLDVYRHLKPLVKFELNKVPEAAETIKKIVYSLPEEIFTINTA